MGTALLAPASPPLYSPLPAQDSVARTLVRLLQQVGVTTVFTVSGGPLMPLLQACHQERLRTIVCRHETNAAFMAATYYTCRRVPALLALTSGPGAANAVNGIMYALREHSAVIIVSARPASAKLGQGAVQDLDTARFLAPMTKSSEQLIHPAQCVATMRRLMATALAHAPGPVNLTVCNDAWSQDTTAGLK